MMCSHCKDSSNVKCQPFIRRFTASEFFLKSTGSESSDIVRFYLRPLFQGQMRIAKLKSAYIA